MIARLRAASAEDRLLLIGLPLLVATLLILSLIHISEPTRLHKVSRMPSSA